MKNGAFTLPYLAKYRKASVYDFPKFGLAKKDEKGVLMVIDTEPTCAFVHWIVTGTRQDKSTHVTKTSGAYFLCLGRKDTLLQNEEDPEACPFCKAAEDVDDAPVGTARFKAATHVIHYGTTPQGVLSTIQGQPPMYQLKVWVFGQQMYNNLIDLKEQWGEHTYRHHDLMVTCVSPTFRNYQLAILPKAVWLEKPHTQFDGKRPIGGLAFDIKALYGHQKLKDLGVILGRLVDVEEATKVVVKAKGTVSAMGAGQTPVQVQTAVNAALPASVEDVDIEDLFSDSSDKPQETITSPSSGDADVDMPAHAASPKADSSENGAAAVVSDDGGLDFETLLGG